MFKKLNNINLCKKWISGLTALFFIFSCVNPGIVSAQGLMSAISFGPEFSLPLPGQKISISAPFQPALLRGVQIDFEDPFHFEFLVDSGESDLDDQAFRDESDKLVKYFLAALTVPEDEIWVNLSPYEKDRIIPGSLGVTGMGRDMLAQDYLLKQLSASLLDPEDEIGQQFWDRIHLKIQDGAAMEKIPSDLFHKIWILPEKAVVYEDHDRAFIVESKLKVMLEEDYLSYKEEGIVRDDFDQTEALHTMREIILPEVQKEINEGEIFAPLRQIYHSLILAVWFKRNLAQSFLGQAYMGQNKVTGIDLQDKELKQKIYIQYLEAFRKGVVDYIREDYDPLTQQIIPRKYFVGGLKMGKELNLVYDNKPDQAMLKKVVNKVKEGIKQVSVALNKSYDDYEKMGGANVAFENDFQFFSTLNPFSGNDISTIDMLLRERALLKNMYFVEKKMGKALLQLRERTIESPEYFANEFSRGEKVVDIGIAGTDARGVKQLFNWLLAEETQNELKEKGFVGVVGESSNHQLIDHLKKRANAFEAEIPRWDAITERVLYFYSQWAKGYPKGDSVRRIVYRFEEKKSELQQSDEKIIAKEGDIADRKSSINSEDDLSEKLKKVSDALEKAELDGFEGSYAEDLAFDYELSLSLFIDQSLNKAIELGQKGKEKALRNFKELVGQGKIIVSDKMLRIPDARNFFMMENFDVEEVSFDVNKKTKTLTISNQEVGEEFRGLGITRFNIAFLLNRFDLNRVEFVALTSEGEYSGEIFVDKLKESGFITETMQKQGGELVVAEVDRIISDSYLPLKYRNDHAMLSTQDKPIKKIIAQTKRVIGKSKKDKAMLGEDNLGGIDFNASNMIIEERGNDVQMERFWGTTDFDIDSIQGFTPVIFNVQPFISLPAFLGMLQPQESEQIASAF